MKRYPVEIEEDDTLHDFYRKFKLQANITDRFTQILISHSGFDLHGSSIKFIDAMYGLNMNEDFDAEKMNLFSLIRKG